MGKPAADTPTPARELEVLSAQRDRALDQLDALVAMVRRIGGFAKPEDQALLRDARSVLVDAGRQVDEGLVAPATPEWASNPPPWERKR